MGAEIPLSPYSQDANHNMSDIKIYTSPTCHYCHAAKEYFAEKGITYQEYDVSKDLAAREEMMQRSGQFGVPVIIIDGNLITGFDRQRIDQLLGSG